MSLHTTFNQKQLMKIQTTTTTEEYRRIRITLTLRDYLIQFVNEYFAEESIHLKYQQICCTID